MWKVCRKTIFPRWHINLQNPVEKNEQKVDCSRAVVLIPTLNKDRYSGENSKRKQHANKRKVFWDDPQFCYYIRTSLLETAGWLGTAVALCLNIHHRHYKSLYHYEGSRSCIFSRLAFAMPHGRCKSGILPIKSESIFSSKNALESGENNVTEYLEPKIKTESDNADSIMHDFKAMMLQYSAELENSIGYQNLNSDDKAAFHSFQEAAHLGSAQGFYNLGQCYDKGKGTEKNLSKAAYCYRQAAMKDHGLATYNLAVYFLNGLGDLPVDSEIAKQLMLEASKLGVPEAQLYVGLEYLEEEMWSDAFTLFSKLADKNIKEGKYYLGICYENGWGIKCDERLALEMFSQAAAQGHLQATLNLGKYYEEGRGGCNENKEFAMALYRMLADKGDMDEEKAIMMLKEKLKSSSLSGVKMSSVKTQKNIMHISVSVPEFTCDKKLNDVKKIGPVTPQYLNLMLPFIPFYTSKLEKPSFYVGDENSSVHSSHMQVLPYLQNPLLRLMVTEI